MPLLSQNASSVLSLGPCLIPSASSTIQGMLAGAHTPCTACDNRTPDTESKYNYPYPKALTARPCLCMPDRAP
jgi:hypothetical protein